MNNGLVRGVPALAALVLLACSDGESAAPASNDTGPLSETDTPAAPELVVAGFKATSLPELSLGCVVEFSTSTPQTAFVQLQSASTTDPLVYAVAGDAEPSTQHRIVVVGVYAGDWDLRAAVKTTGGVQRSAPHRWTAGPPPASVVDAEVVTVVDAEVATASGATADNSWTLTQLGRGQPWVAGPTDVVIYDLKGRVRWYSPNQGGPVGLATMVNDGSAVLSAAGSEVKEVALDGTVRWTSPGEPEGVYTWWELKDAAWHHEYHKLPGGNYAVVRRRTVEGVSRDVIEEMAPDGNVLATYDSQVVSDAIGSPCYGSAGVIDHQRGKVLYASRNGGVVAQMNQDSGAIDWILGAKGTLAHGAGDWSWFSDPHSPTVLSDDGKLVRLLLLDSSTAEVGRTRAVEFEVDLVAKTATLVWEFPPAGPQKDVWYSPGGGSVQRLSNGNTSIATMEAGPDDPLSFARVRLMETTAAGEVVSHLKLEGDYLLYRAQRIPPLLRVASELGL